MYKGGVNPEEKALYVTNKSSEHRTMMAGDGFNGGRSCSSRYRYCIGSGDQVNLDAADVLIPERILGLSRMIVSQRGHGEWYTQTSQFPFW